MEKGMNALYGVWQNFQLYPNYVYPYYPAKLKAAWKQHILKSIVTNESVSYLTCLAKICVQNVRLSHWHTLSADAATGQQQCH